MKTIKLLQKDTKNGFFKPLLFTMLLFIYSSFASAQVLNSVEQITSAQGMGNDGCVDVHLASNGELWVVHSGFTPAVSYNSNRPISHRDVQGNWSYPDLSQAPAVTNNNFTYNSSNDYKFDKIYEDSNGNIWFLPYYSSVSTTDMGFAPPMLMYDGVNWNSFHSSAGNFPNMGSILDMVEDNAGNLWFGCGSGLVRMTPAGAFSTFNPPAVPYKNGLTKQADNIISVDINNAGNIVMVASQQNTANGGGFGGWACVRQFEPAANTWNNWHLSDAPWYNALQVYYQPRKVVAMHDASDRLYISTVGGGLYYIDNADFANNTNTMISDYQGWSYPGFAFENIYTNLADFTYDVFRSERGEFWTTVLGSSANVNGVYKFESRTPATWGGAAAWRYNFAKKSSNFSITTAGQTYHAQIISMDFGPNDDEIWFATEQGLERWYSDFPLTANDFIGIEGAGEDKSGVVAFNANANGLPEPIAKGHELPVGTPSNSIDTAYYYIASSDYDNLDSTVDAGLQGDGAFQGFAQTAAALNANGYDWSDIQLKFTPIDLGDDIRGDNDDWQYNNKLETRRYQNRIEQINDSVSETRSHYTILIDGFPMFSGDMPLVNMGIRFNKYGYLFDSIAAVSDFVPIDTTNWLDDLCDCLPNPQAQDVARAMAQDIGEFGIRFSFRSIQNANKEDLNSAGRTGGFYSIRKAMLEKGTVPIAAEGPMGGIIRVGTSMHAEYFNLERAIRDLNRRGMNSWVQFRIEPGIYEGIFEFGDIPGQAGFNNRNIMLMSHTGDSNDVVVRKKPGRRDTNYVFKMSGADDVSFHRITIENTENTDSSTVFYVDDFMDRLSISNCRIRGPLNATGGDEADLLRMEQRAIELDMRKNLWEGGNRSAFVKVRDELHAHDNRFVDHQDFALYIDEVDEAHISRNRFEGPSSGRFNGVYLGDVDDAVFLKYNRFINQDVPCTRAIEVGWFADPGTYALGGIQIFNNEISVVGDDQTEAVYLSGNYTKFYHNNVFVSGIDNGSLALFSDFAWDDVRIWNNIIQSENGRLVFHNSFAGFGWGADLDENIYHSQLALPFSVDIGAGVQNLATVADMQQIASTDSNSFFIDPQFNSPDFLLPMNPATHDLALPLFEVDFDINLVQRPQGNYDHGCYIFDSTEVPVNCQDVYNAQMSRLNNFYVRIDWSDAGHGTYRLNFREVGAANWRSWRVGDTSRVIGPLPIGDYEYYISDRRGNNEGCTETFSLDCEDISYSSLTIQIRNRVNLGAIRVFGVSGGRRKWDFGLDNGTDTTWLFNRRAAVYSRLQSGTYFVHVRDKYGCYSSQIDTLVIEDIDTTRTPRLTSLQNLGGGTLRPIWTVDDTSNIDRYQIRVKDITAGSPGVVYGNYNVPGAGTTQFDIAGLPAGTYRVDVIARINGSFDNSIYSNNRERIVGAAKRGTDAISSAGEELLIYPNPASEEVFVQSKVNGQLELLDLNGRVLQSMELNEGKQEIKLSEYSAGIYLIKISSGSGVFTKRLIKE